jgi:hypothetical protein
MATLPHFSPIQSISVQSSSESVIVDSLTSQSIPMIADGHLNSSIHSTPASLVQTATSPHYNMVHSGVTVNNDLLFYHIATQVWTLGAPPSARIPKSRYSHTVCAYNGRIYLYGGKNDEDHPFSAVECFDIGV